MGLTGKAKVRYTDTSAIFIGVLIISFIAFWPTYYAVFFSSDFYVHFHAAFAVLWFIMLIVQPFLIKSRRLEWHRLIGKISYLVAPLVIVSIVLLANNSIKEAAESFYSIQTYLLYLQISLAFLFAVTYALAIYFRKTKPVHERLMVATAFTFVDPILARLLLIISPDATFNYQWVSFGLINAILIILAIVDLKNRKAKWVYPGLLILYLLVEIPIFFNLTPLTWWQQFAGWFASL